MSKKIKGSYLLNAVGVALVFALLTGLFAANAFGTSTTYIQGICTTACYTIIMVTSLNLVVGFMGEFSLGHAGFVSVGAYVSAIVSGALAGKGLSDLGLFLIALLVGGLAAGIMGVLVGIPALRLRGDYLAIGLHRGFGFRHQRDLLQGHDLCHQRILCRHRRRYLCPLHDGNDPHQLQL